MTASLSFRPIKKKHKRKRENIKFRPLLNHSPLLLFRFIPGNGGAPFNEPSPLLPRDGAPLRDDSPPADFDAENKKHLSVKGISFRYYVVNLILSLTCDQVLRF